MITFAMKVQGTPPGWRNLSGNLRVRTTANSLKEARRFCAGAAEAFKANLPAGLALAPAPPCDLVGVPRTVLGTWYEDPVRSTSAPIGRPPEVLQSILERFSPDQLRLQLLFVDCHEEDTEPDICFQVLAQSQPLAAASYAAS